MKQIYRLYMLLVAGSLLMASCSKNDDLENDEPGAGKVTGIELNKDALTLHISETATLVATVLPEDASQEVKWKSRNEAVCTVDADGKVTAVDVGSTTILVTSVEGNKSTTCKVEVVPDEEKVIKGVTCILVRGGTFQMGSPASEADRKDNETQHSVTLTKNFYLGKYEVTCAQFCTFLNEKNVGEDGMYNTTANGTMALVRADEVFGVYYQNGEWIPAEGMDNFAVSSVTWYGADEFCRWAGGSLPTEAQWEYACRAGTTTSYSCGDNSADALDYGWFTKNAGRSPHEVGKKKPNPWGFYDMHGGVCEWCLDSWDGTTAYGSEAVTDPVSPNPDDNKGVIRGGSWQHLVNDARSASRHPYELTYANLIVGFRLAFVLP